MNQAPNGSSARFEAIRARMAAHAGDDGVAGLAWTVAVGDDATSGAAGTLDPRRDDRPVPLDGVFRIASVSKPIAAVAALQLVQDGLIGFDEPLDDALPELARRRVLVDPYGPLDGATVPAARSLTLADLLTFRCGIGINFDESRPQPQVERMWSDGTGPGPTPPEHPPERYMELLGELPLVDQPGARWRYHTGFDIASVLIERLRGEPLDEVLRRRVTEPLGMVDTGFRVRPDQIPRVGVARMGDDANPTGPPVVWDEPDGRWSVEPAFRSGATGLVSTTADLVAFGRMLLRRGVGPSGRVLAEDLVDRMVSDHLDDDQRIHARIDGTGDSLGWGLGVAVRRREHPSGWPGIGSYGWDGGLGSRFIVDPDADLCAVLLTTDGFNAPATPGALDGFLSAVGDELR